MDIKEANTRFERFRTDHPTKPFIFEILDDSQIICIIDKEYMDKLNSPFKGYFQLEGDRYVCIKTPPVRGPNPFQHFNHPI